MTTEEELEQLRHENRALREAKQELREGLGQAIQAIEAINFRKQSVIKFARVQRLLSCQFTVFSDHFTVKLCVLCGVGCHRRIERFVRR